MAKNEQVLKIKPATELTFVGPFNQQVSSVMHLTNPSDRKVCFKIKTTAPKRYCVKPNSGVVDSEQTVKIAVTLQPFDFNPQEKSKHKFMVQSMFAPEGEIIQEILWKEVDAAQLMDCKMKCVFIVPESNVTSNGNFKSNTPVAANTADHLSNSIQATESFLSSNNELYTTSQKGDTKTSFSQAEVVGDGDSNVKKSVEEIRKLQEEISTLRQDNIQLREEALRQKRLASSRVAADAVASTSPVGPSGSFKVPAMNPDATTLSTAYLYMALIILILGIVIGKWVF